MNPFAVKKEIGHALIEQVNHLRPVHSHEEAFDVSKFEFCKDVFVERIPFYAQSDKSLQELADNGLIASETAQAFAKFFNCKPEEFKPYTHQVEAIKDVGERGKNLIVCTGTGSGKTESFLMPVIDSIIRERKDKGVNYKSGIRALILYPMNALVNDQVSRIRRLVKGALEADIAYAKDITYGIYTRELKEQTQEKNDYPFPEECFDKNIVTHHSSITADDIPPSEYITRSRWAGEDGCADIMITNHVMLEQLLLNPEKRFMFNADTWRFIVLDEAHSYDGGSGTDISWLIRRVAERCAVNGNIGQDRAKNRSNIQYIATSATLLEDDNMDESEKIAKIQSDFAAAIFPAEGGTFSVQLGRTHELNSSQLVGDDNYDFVKIVNYPVRNEIIDLYSSVVSDCLEIYKDESLYGALMKMLLPQHQDHEYTLIELTQWYLSLKKHLKEAWAWLIEAKDAQIEHIDANGRQSLGDAMYVAEQLCSVNPKFLLPLREGSIKNLQSCYNAIKHPRDEKKIKSIIASHIEGSKNIEEVYTQFAKNKGGFTAERFIILLNIICSYIDIEKSKICDYVVEWENIDFLNKLRGVLKKVAQALYGDGNNSLERQLLAEWQIVLGKNGESIESVVTSALMHSKELKSLYNNIEKFSRCDEQFLKDAHLQSEDSFSALAQLLTLSEHPDIPRRPIMDLRFHLMVNGISGSAVYFKKNDAGEIKPHFIFSEDPMFENEYYKDEETGDKYTLFTLGICYDCGQPYILVYEIPRETSDKGYAIRWGNTTDGTFKAYSWTQGNHGQEDDSNVNRDTFVWLDIYTSSIEVTKEDKKPGDSYIRLYYQAEASKSSTFIATCPACGGSRLLPSGDGYGVIAPYKSGSANDKNSIMRCMIRNADPSICSHGVLAQGRKLLAFSDTRPGAAQLARNLDADIEEFLMKQLLTEIIKQKISDVDSIEQLYELPGCKNLQIFECKDEDEVDTIKEIIRDKKKDKISEDEYREKLSPILESKLYGSSLTAMLPVLYKKLRDSEALSLLDKEYKKYEYSSENKKLKPVTGAYSMYAALSLLICATLRSNRREGLVKKGHVKVSSAAMVFAKKDGVYTWEDYARRFKNVNDAVEYFEYIYRIIYLNSYLDCSEYDKEAGKYYECETDRLVDGYSSGIWSKKCYYTLKKEFSKETVSLRHLLSSANKSSNSKSKNSNITKAMTKLKDYGITRTKDVKDVIESLWDFMIDRNIIIKDKVNDDINAYRLNLDDVRYSLVKEGNDPIREEQYYRVEEHTAQLSSSLGRIYQDSFSLGRINILSCSTTYEMGVDLGDLNCVFMANMPPSVASYKQRAGRAGRRSGSSSLVVTYLGDSGHDDYFRQKPEEFIMGRVQMPVIYKDNVGYRAKHFRAEALAYFLQSIQPLESKWKTCGFFFGEDKDAPIRRLHDWVKEHGETLQSHCKRLNSRDLKSEVDITIGKTPYSVAEDLQWQLIGENMSSHFASHQDELCPELTGPHLPNDMYNIPLEQRYRITLRRVEKLKNELITNYFAENRVLPRYGFPCDVIKLLPAKGEDYKEVDLNRDVRQGLFEYAPGKDVIANKRSYSSHYPVSFALGIDEDGNPRVDNGKELHIMPVNVCSSTKHPVTYFPAEEEKCPICGGKGKKQSACVPDAFKAKRSSKARSFSPATHTGKNIVYPGKTNDSCKVQISDSCVAYASDIRALWYINDDFQKPKFDEEPDENADEENSKERHRTPDYNLLLRQVRTDIALISAGEGKNQLDGITDFAWKSALAAILKATAEVLNVSSRDVAGFVTSIGEKKYMLIYDNSPSGSGAVLSLIPNRETAHNLAVRNNIRDLLRRAREICDSNCECNMGLHDNLKWSVPHRKKLQDTNNPQLREACSCYKCLKSYTNQSIHSELDANDAWRVLNWLLEGVDESECTDHTHESEMPPVSVPDVESVPNDAGRGTVSGVEEKGDEKGRCMPPPTQLSPQDIKNIRFNNGVKGNRYLVWSDGKEIEVECRICMGNGIVSVLQGDRLLEVPVRQFIKKI